MADPDAGDGESAVDVSMEIDAGRTLLTVTGERAVAVIVESESGEQIYLPPEDFAGTPDRAGQTPYDSPYDASPTDDTPYEGGRRSDSPYESAADASPYGSGRSRSQSVGLQSTSDGFRIHHPEPVTDVRLLR